MIQKQILKEVKSHISDLSLDLYDIATNKKYQSLHKDYDVIDMYSKTYAIISLINAILNCKEDK